MQLSRPRSAHHPLMPPWDWWPPSGPIGTGYASPHQYDAPAPDVMMWVSEGQNGWKNDRWTAVERPQRVREIGFRLAESAGKPVSGSGRGGGR